MYFFQLVPAVEICMVCEIWYVKSEILHAIYKRKKKNNYDLCQSEILVKTFCLIPCKCFKLEDVFKLRYHKDLFHIWNNQLVFATNLMFGFYLGGNLTYIILNK